MKAFKTILFALSLLGTGIPLKSQFISKLSFGMKGGVNFSIPQVKQAYNAFASIEPDSYNAEQKKITKNVGSQYAFIAAYNFSDRFSLHFQPAWSNYNIKYTNSYTWEGENQNYGSENNFTQKLQYIELPLRLQYQFRKKNWKPYGYIGTAYGLRETATKYISRTEETAYGTFEHNTTALGNDSTYISSKVSAYAGLGLAYQFKRSSLGIETGFTYGFNNITRRDYRYNSTELSGDFYDIPDDIKLHLWSINIVYQVSLRCAKPVPLPSYENL